MKKILAGFIIGVFVTLGVTTFADEIRSFVAEKATFEVYVNGQKFDSDKPIVAIEGSTYLPLKATGEALGVDVNWNSDKKRVEVGSVNDTVTEIKKESTPSIVETTPAPIAVSTPAPQSFDSNKKAYNLKSNTLEFRLNRESIITYQDDYYIPASVFAYIKNIDGDFFIELPGKQPVNVKANSYEYYGTSYIKISALGLNVNFEGDTAWID